MRLEVEKEMESLPLRRIGPLPVTIWMPISLPVEEKQVLERVVKTCLVHKALASEIVIPIVMIWDLNQKVSEDLKN